MLIAGLQENDLEADTYHHPAAAHRAAMLAGTMGCEYKLGHELWRAITCDPRAKAIAG